jgi:hypothetical protein
MDEIGMALAIEESARAPTAAAVRRAEVVVFMKNPFFVLPDSRGRIWCSKRKENANEHIF